MSSSKSKPENPEKASAIGNIEQAMVTLKEAFVNDQQILSAFSGATSGTGSYDQYSDK